jgi:hypothetical protein
MALTTENTDILFAINRVSYLGEPTYWEGTALCKNQVICQTTGPTYLAVLDTLTNSMTDEGTVVNQTWLDWDANNK